MGEQAEVSVRDLRNHGGRVLDRVARGEPLTVTRDGSPVAELRPIRRPSLAPGRIDRPREQLPKVDPDRLRQDIDAVVDQSCGCGPVVVSHQTGVLDTSAVLRLDELSEGDLPAESVITVVTLAELTVGPLVADAPATRAARQVQVQNAEVNFGDPLPFDTAAARAFGQVAADLRSSGRKRTARVFDALIAATAKASGLPVYTFNADDFEGIAGLEVVELSPPLGSG